MQNSFIQVTNDSIILNKSDLVMYAIAAAVVIVLIIVIAIALKSRKKNFIRTVPTHLKGEE